MLRGKASTLGVTLAPVVVKPLMLSKTASVIPENAPLVQSGIAPRKHTPIHTPPTMQNAREGLIGTRSVLRFIRHSPANNRHANEGTANAQTVRRSSAYHIEDVTGSRSASPTIPSTWATILKNGNRISPASRHAVEHFLKLLVPGPGNEYDLIAAKNLVVAVRNLERAFARMPYKQQKTLSTHRHIAKPLADQGALPRHIARDYLKAFVADSVDR